MQSRILSSGPPLLQLSKNAIFNERYGDEVTLVGCTLKQAGRLSGHNCYSDVLRESGPLRFLQVR